MKTSVIKSLSITGLADLAFYPSISKHVSQKNIIEFITGCKYIIVCGGYIFVVNFEIYDIAEVMFENFIDTELRNNNLKDFLLKIKALNKSILNVNN